MMNALVYVLLLASTTCHGAPSPKHYLVETKDGSSGRSDGDYSLGKIDWRNPPDDIIELDDSESADGGDGDGTNLIDDNFIDPDNPPDDIIDDSESAAGGDIDGTDLFHNNFIDPDNPVDLSHDGGGSNSSSSSGRDYEGLINSPEYVYKSDHFHRI